MIRHLRQTLSLLLSLAALAVLPSVSAQAASSGAAPRLELPAPDKSGGLPLMQALAQRHSTKSGFSGEPLTPQQLGDLLWATWGVNRADGRRTAPSAMNRAGSTVWAYPGCPQGRGFDETGDKGFLFGDVTAEGADLEFIPFARRRYQSVTADVTDCDPAEAVRQALEGDCGQDICRVLYLQFP